MFNDMHKLLFGIKCIMRVDGIRWNVCAVLYVCNIPVIVLLFAVIYGDIFEGLFLTI